MTGCFEDTIELSVVLPCLNEEVTLGKCIAAAQAMFAQIDGAAELIVADNGSTDRSRDIALSSGVRVVEVAARGYGSALRAGLAAAQGKYLVFLDADMSYDFADIPRFLDALREGADVVIGSRFRGGIEPDAMPWLHRHLGTPCMTWAANLFFGCGVSDINCGLRGMRCDVFKRLDLHSQGMEFASEMMIKAAQAQMKIVELPIVLHADQRENDPHLRSFRDGWRHLQLMLHFCPYWVFLVPTILFLFIGGAFIEMPGMLGGYREFRWFGGLWGVFMLNMGLQIFLLGLIAQGRVTASKYPRRKTGSWGMLSRLIRIEKGILLGAIVMLAALFSAVIVLGLALRTDAGDGRILWSYARGLLWSGAAFSMGTQVFFVSLLMGLFGIRVAEDE